MMSFKKQMNKILLSNKTPKMIKKIGSRIYNHYQSQIPSYTIETSTVCNLECRFCPHPKTKFKKEFISPHIWNLALAEIKRFHPFNYPNKKLKLVYGGLGEPLLFPGYKDHLRKIRQEFPKAHIQLDTNGVVLDIEKTNILIKEHLVDFLSISLNSPNRELYKKLMMRDQFDTVINNIYDFVKMRNFLGSEIVISVCVKDTDDNRIENSSIKEQLNSILSEKDQFWINDILNWGGEIDVEGLKSKSLLKPMNIPCYGVLIVSNIVIDINGNVYPCCMPLGTSRELSDLKLGNICEKHLDEIWKYRLPILKKIMMNGNIKNILSCKNCTAFTDESYDLFFSNPLPIGKKFF